LKIEYGNWRQGCDDPAFKSERVKVLGKAISNLFAPENDYQIQDHCIEIGDIIALDEVHGVVLAIGAFISVPK
jgi:hypothetical protein